MERDCECRRGGYAIPKAVKNTEEEKRSSGIIPESSTPERKDEFLFRQVPKQVALVERMIKTIRHEQPQKAVPEELQTVSL